MSTGEDKTRYGIRLEEKLGFDRIRAMVSDRCSSDYAVARVKEECFSTSAPEIRHRLLLTDEMRLILMFEDSFPTTGFVDCLPFLVPLERGGCIDLLSLGKLRTLLDTLRRIVTFFKGMKDGVYPNLKKLSASTRAFPEISLRIDSILDRSGEVKDTASDELLSIRRSLKEKEAGLSKRMQAILRKAQQDGMADADAAVTVRDGKMLIPVNPSGKNRFAGFVHDESATGRTAFMEPAEIVALTNEINGLRFSEQREIARILSAFSDFIRPYCGELQGAAVFVGETDFIMAKARLALDLIAGMPIISEDGTLALRKARHPLLEIALKKERKEIVPVSLTLTPSKHILLVSGPNAGGKSVCLKTAGLLQQMFQWGMLIPTSETSELPVFDRIMVSIGDDQSIENDLSTYSSFLSDMKAVLSEAGPSTLVLIDEFGSGTEPAAGGAIAESILAELDRRGVYGIITTHYTNLKLYASSPGSGVVNGAMQFDPVEMAPLFKLEVGLPGNSFAFELARKMGIPETIVSEAEKKAGEEFVGMERNLRKIERNRRALDEKLQKIRATDKTLDDITVKYRKELEDIKRQRKEIIDEAREEAGRIVRDANRQVENTIRTIRESQAEKEATKEARKDLQEFIGALERKKEQEGKDRAEYIENKLKTLKARQERSKERQLRRADPTTLEGLRAEEERRRELEAFRNAPLKAGEKVRLRDGGMVGEVSKVSTKSVTVIVGNISTKLPLDRVERITAKEYSEGRSRERKPAVNRYSSSISERKLNFRPEIDVRGQRVTEAIENVMRLVDDAIMLDFNCVRILHGKGTGALREEIQKFVKTIPGVVSVSDEHVERGGSGVTVVTF